MKYLILLLILSLKLTAQVSPTSVSQFSQGQSLNYTEIDSLRSNPLKAINQPENSDIESQPYNFVALGFGGSITLQFDSMILVNPNKVLQVFETTWGYQCSQYPESADIYISSDSINWTFVGRTCGNSNQQLSLVDSDSLKWIRIEDKSLRSSFINWPNADGFDLDGVIIYESSPLQIALQDFTVTYKDFQIDIWITTASETSSWLLEVAASPDTYTWTQIAQFTAAGYSTTTRSYETGVRYEPIAHTTYFRLQEIDLSGKITTTQIIAIETPLPTTRILFHYDILGRRVNENNSLYKTR